MPTGPVNPFGVDGAIIGDSEVDFRVEIIATFTAADYDGDFRSDDGFYTPTIRFFGVLVDGIKKSRITSSLKAVRLSL